ncbi:hypothetical protein F5Y17DRAFT_474304 [Xylariaceae sp. FL0594]|nr:hypothetical protein F5Y17DRAFT_474304 [Xylariaceae sp. FL0594]
MRRRNSTASSRLDRRKSTSSGKSVRLEHIEPQTAERDAQAAATEAFSRARERSATESSTVLWPPPRSTGPGSTRPSLDAGSIHREKSIRFVPSKPLLLDPSANTSSQTPSGSTRFPFQERLTAEGEPDLRSPGNASASGLTSATKGAAGDLVGALFSPEERYTAEDDIASMPSSYRRLRKSRSMFTDGVIVPEQSNARPGRLSASTNQLPSPEGSPFRTPRSNENIPPRLRTPKSITFLRDLRSNFGPMARTDATSPGRSRLGEFSENQARSNTLRNKSSRFLRTRPPTTDRVFRKSMRDASSGTISTVDKPVKDRSLRYRARKVSQGFKHKLKNLFGLSTGSGSDSTIPQQHIEAARPTIVGLDELDDEDEYDFHDAANDDEEVRTYIISRIPSLHEVPSSQKLRSRHGSIDSIGSEQQGSDDRSRVTSRSTSDANTITSVNSGRERERKRLSVIKENGTHVCSSSAAFPTVYEQANSSAASLHPPPQIQAAPTSDEGPRIYSALMKRAAQSQGRQSSESERRNSVEEFVKSGTTPHRTSSLQPRRLTGSLGSTIRYVAPDFGSESESSEATNSSYMVDREPSQGLRQGLSIVQKPTYVTALEKPSPQVTSRKYTNSEATFGHDGEADTRSAAAKSGKPSLGQPVSPRSSAFFGSPTRHLFRTQSPFRRALQDRIQAEADSAANAGDKAEEKGETSDQPDSNPWMRSLSNLHIRRPSVCGSDVDNKMCYSESIYSTQTDDYQYKKPVNTSSLSQHGDATIFPSTSGVAKISSPTRKQRVSSSASSVEWKTWLSSNMSKIEESTSKRPNDAGFRYDVEPAGTGHVRERAQIMDDDDQDDLASANFRKPSEEELLSRPFDAGKSRTSMSHTRMSYASSLASTPSTSKDLKMGETSSTVAQENAAEIHRPDREKLLPRLPSISSLASRSIRRASITSKLANRRLGGRTSKTPLTTRNPSGTGEDQQTKANVPKPQQKFSGTAYTKPENINPETANEDDPYGTEGDDILGPSQQSREGRGMLNGLLSSRRRRLASSEESSAFL